MEELPSTQTQEENIEFAIELQNPPWGRLCSLIASLASIDLIDRTYSFGRSPSCNIVVDNIGLAPILNISKEHFQIVRDYNDVVYLVDSSKNGTFVNDIKIGKNNKYMVYNNDTIAVGDKNCKVYTYTSIASQDTTYYPEEMRKKYSISKRLGRGAFGDVKLAYDRRSFKKFAIKKIKKANSSNTSIGGNVAQPQKVKTEIEILSSFSYDFIIQMEQVFETDREVFLVLEFMEGGELTSRIMSTTPFPEAQVKFIFYQILLAVRFLHLNGVTHRDLKPENVLLQSANPYPHVKVSDFGLSKIMDENSLMETVCGTIHYAAPEVLNCYERYNKKVDIWSLGVILFYMLSRTQPFEAPDRQSVAKKILAGKIGWENKTWKSISAGAKDLTRKMLVVNPELRYSIVETLKHDWIDKDFYMKRKIDSLSTSSDESSSSEELLPVSKRARLYND